MIDTLISNVTVLDGKSDSAPFVGSVGVSDHRITSIDSEAVTADIVIDGAGKFLVPGLIDCHVHLFLNAEPTATQDFIDADDNRKNRWAEANARTMLTSGVTTIRDIAAPTDLMTKFLLRARSGSLPAPRVVPALANITTKAGHGYFLGVEATTAGQIRSAARNQIAAGARLLKVMASGGVMTPDSDPSAVQYSVDELRIVTGEAAAAGLPTAAHAHGLQAIKNAIEAGITSIEHGVFLDRPTADLMANRGTWLVPTLATFFYVDQNISDAAFPDRVRRKIDELRPIFYRQVDLALEAGVRIAAGTDVGVPFTRHSGDTLARELSLYVERGMSPRHAIASATSLAAELLRISDEIGTLEPGKVADMLLLNDDPTRDLTTLGRPELVWQAGSVVS